MSADVGFAVRVHLLNVRLNESAESAALGWTVQAHREKTVGLYYKGRFVWMFDANGKTPRELMAEIVSYVGACMNFLDVLKEAKNDSK